ncbi:MAG: ABC-2 family transporter protein [Deinococcales bacterium]
MRKGSFDLLRLRPLPHLFLQIFASDFPLRRLGRLALGIGIFALALNLNPIEWTLAKILYLPWVILGMVCFFGGLFIIGAAFTFWTVEGLEALNIFTYGGSFLISYPMHIYPDWLRFSFSYIVPAIFLNYYPALYFLNKEDPFNLPAFAPFLAPWVGLGVLVVALKIWAWGLRHYHSTEVRAYGIRGLSKTFGSRFASAA